VFEEKITLEAEEMQELAYLVSEALARGDSRESVIADLSENGVPEDEAEDLVSSIEAQAYQIDAGPVQQESDGEGGYSWLIWVGIFVLFRILRHIFN